MRQIVYISTLAPGVAADSSAVLRVSQANNARDGITGLLFFNGKRFLQALEGPEAAISATLARIYADPRHRAIVVLSTRDIAAREFGSWTMADATAVAEPQRFLLLIERLVAHAAPDVRASFTGFAQVPAAA